MFFEVLCVLMIGNSIMAIDERILFKEEVNKFIRNSPLESREKLIPRTKISKTFRDMENYFKNHDYSLSAIPRINELEYYNGEFLNTIRDCELWCNVTRIALSEFPDSDVQRQKNVELHIIKGMDLFKSAMGMRIYDFIYSESARRANIDMKRLKMELKEKKQDFDKFFNDLSEKMWSNFLEEFKEAMISYVSKVFPFHISLRAELETLQEELNFCDIVDPCTQPSKDWINENYDLRIEQIENFEKTFEAALVEKKEKKVIEILVDINILFIFGVITSDYDDYEHLKLQEYKDRLKKSCSSLK